MKTKYVILKENTVLAMFDDYQTAHKAAVKYKESWPDKLFRLCRLEQIDCV